MRILSIIFLLTFPFNSFAQESNIDSSRFYNVAVIQVLDKTTAKSSILEIPVRSKVDLGSLKIIAHKCWQAPLDQKPESKILIEVFETQHEKDLSENIRIFYGWIFASTPSISGLENPIYDLTALNCKNK